MAVTRFFPVVLGLAAGAVLRFDIPWAIGTSGCPPYDEAWEPRTYSPTPGIPPTPRIYGYRLEVNKSSIGRRSGLAAPGDPSMDPHTIVGVAVDGVLLQRASRADAVDLCGGVRTSRGAYAYRSIPFCLLRALNDTTPPDAAIRASEGRPRRESWPKLAPPSPLIGYAIDGREIYGPYDETGQLASGLDACNFKQSRYHLTPEHPYYLGCLAGRPGVSWTTYAPQNVEDTVECGPPPRRALQRRTNEVAARAGGAILDILKDDTETITAFVRDPSVSVWPSVSAPTLLNVLSTQQADAAILDEV